MTTKAKRWRVWFWGGCMILAASAALSIALMMAADVFNRAGIDYAKAVAVVICTGLVCVTLMQHQRADADLKGGE